MLLPWRRRGGASRPASSEEPESPTQEAASQTRHTHILHKTHLAPSAQSEPIDRHQQSVAIGSAASSHMGTCDATPGGVHISARTHFVSKLLPPIRFRRRHATGFQSESVNWGLQSNSVPAVVQPENVSSATRLPLDSRLTGNNSHVVGLHRSASNDASPLLKGTDYSVNVRHLPAAAAATTAPPHPKGERYVGVILRGSAATARADPRSNDASEVQRSEGTAEGRQSEEEERQPPTQRQSPITQRYLEAVGAARCRGAEQRKINSPRGKRDLCESRGREVRFEGREPGPERILCAGVDSSERSRQQQRNRGQLAAVPPTVKHTAAVAAPSGAASSGRPSWREKGVCASQLWKARQVSVEQKAVQIPSCVLQTAAAEETSSHSAIKSASASTHKTTAAKNSLPHLDNSTPQKVDAEKRSANEENRPSCRRTPWGVLSIVSTKGESRVKKQENTPAVPTSAGECLQQRPGVQQCVSPSTFSRWQKGGGVAAPENALSPACAAITHWKTQDAPQSNKQQATAKDDSLPAVRCHPLPCFRGGDRLRTIWSVGGLSDALIVRRGLATVLLMDKVGNAALLRRALSKPGEWQQEPPQHINPADATDYEDVKILTELPPKVRSRHVILNLLQGVVSLQQVLPVDVTYAQADLRVLSLPQLLVLRLRNSHENQLSSSYHSCHASFLHTLDCRVAEVLGALLVNVAFFELFAPLVEEQKQQQQKLRSGRDSGPFCVATGAQQSPRQQEVEQSPCAPSAASFSRASTRSSTPQNLRARGEGEEEGHGITTAALEGGGEAELEKQQCGNGRGNKQMKCQELKGSGAATAAAVEAGKQEGDEGRTLRGRVTWAEDLQAPHGAARSDGDVCAAVLEGAREASSSFPELRKRMWKAFSKATGAATGEQTTANVDERERERRVNMQRESQQQQQPGTEDIHRRECTTLESERLPDRPGREQNEMKPCAALVEKQARFLVNCVAEKGLLDTYSGSSFDIPAGEAAAGRAQLRALGAAFVRQLGLIVSAAGKSEGHSSSSTSSSDSVSAADLCVLQRVQNYILPENTELQPEGELPGEDVTGKSVHTAEAGGKQTRILDSHTHAKKPVAVGSWIKMKRASSVASPAPATTVAISRPAGVWIRLLVPCRHGTQTVKRAGPVRDAARDSPVVAAAAATGCGEEKAAGQKVLRETRKEKQEAGRRGEDGIKPGDEETRACSHQPHPGATSAAGRQEDGEGMTSEAGQQFGKVARFESSTSSSGAACATARANLAAAIAAARLRKAASPTLETESKTHFGENTSEKEWMEAFLWLRLPSHSKGPVGYSNAGAAAGRNAGEEASALLQPQRRPGETQAATTAEDQNTRGRGVFELVVSNDRPVGEVLLWGLALQNTQLLCRSSGSGGLTGNSSSSTRAKWTVVAIPETAALQQHLGHDGKVTDVVSELKEMLSRRCGVMKPAAEYEGGAACTAAAAASSQTAAVGLGSPCC